jgi:hypothetical protein
LEATCVDAVLQVLERPHLSSASSDSKSIRQELVQAIAIPRRDFENPIVSYDTKSLAGAIDENAAPVAAAQVLFDFGAKLRINIFVDVVGQLFQ